MKNDYPALHMGFSRSKGSNGNTFSSQALTLSDLYTLLFSQKFSLLVVMELNQI